MTLKKAEQRNVVLFTLAHGPCAARSVHLYCADCQIDYHHNYTVSGGIRTYYDEQPKTIQVMDHVFMEKDVVELFKMAMDVSWTSATNCARLYNMCLSQGKCAPDSYLVKFEITGDHVWDAFVITTLLEDCKRCMCSLTVPQTGNQQDQFMQAMIDRNRCIQLYGFEDVRQHYCNRCTRMYANDQGVTTHKVSVVVVDGVTVGHPCCVVRNCHTPLSNNHHRFCPAHSSYNGMCSIIGCNLPVVPGRRTCLTPDHKHVEGTDELCGQSRFQLQEHFAHARVAHPNDTISQDVEISTPHPPDAEEEYKLNEMGTLALPLSTVTFFRAEGVASVVQFIKNVYAGNDSMTPDHIFFDNNCTLSKMVKDDPFFEGIGLSVDVFYFNCKHSESNTYCQANCNPVDYLELLGDNGKGWRFNSSVAEQTNGWFGGYHSICHEMLAHKFNFFCDELILRRNRRTKHRLRQEGHNPRTWPTKA
ncbi:hypothetical protein BDR03DRAFT_1050033 [Suillus americanus]|nr:hypothetical protein BDR03DRAFT_1050033 [Suillus americanus]